MDGAGAGDGPGTGADMGDGIGAGKSIGVGVDARHTSDGFWVVQGFGQAGA